MPRDYYEVLGVAPRRRRRRDQEGVPAARARAASGRQQPRSRSRGASSRRLPRRTRCCPIPIGARRTTATATKGCAAAATRRTSRGSGRSRTSSRRSSAAARQPVRRHLRRRRAAGGAIQGGDVAVGAEITLAQAQQRRPGRGLLRGDLDVRALPRERRRARDPDRDVRAVRRRRPAAGGDADAVRPGRARRAVRRVPRRRAGAARAVPRCGGRGRRVERAKVSVDVPAGIADGQRIRVSGRGHAGERGGPPGDLYVQIRVREDPRFVRDGDDLVTAVDVAAPLAALGTTVEVPTVDGHGRARDPRRDAAARDAASSAARGCPRSAAAAPATCAWSSTS